MRLLARWLRALADRIDHEGAPRIISWSFTFERGKGIVFRQDGNGCPLAYLGSEDYERAHSEADSVTGPMPAYTVELPCSPAARQMWTAPRSGWYEWPGGRFVGIDLPREGE